MQNCININASANSLYMYRCCLHEDMDAQQRDTEKTEKKKHLTKISQADNICCMLTTKYANNLVAGHDVAAPVVVFVMASTVQIRK